MLTGFAGLSIAVYRTRVDVDALTAGSGVLGPPGREFTAAAERHMEAGLEILNDRTLPAAERLSGYRGELAKAERLLIEGLRAQPTQAYAIARLAAVRWELDPPFTEEAQEPFVGMIRTASAMAPTMPRVQQSLGELLLRMGRPDEGAAYLARTLELDPSLADSVVESMRSGGLTAATMLAALPRQPAVLAALYEPFREAGKLDAYVHAVESTLPVATPTLLGTYTTAAIASGEAEGARKRLRTLEFLTNPNLEAARFRQIGRLDLTLDDLGGALSATRRARSLAPSDPWIADALGDVYLRSERSGEAIREYRAALALVARGSANPRFRAQLYRKIGQAQEAAGRPDDAYEAYRKAVDLDPEESIASRRLDAMHRAAGVAP